MDNFAATRNLRRVLPSMLADSESLLQSILVLRKFNEAFDEDQAAHVVKLHDHINGAAASLVALAQTVDYTGGQL
jgi:hypothetical protein